MKKIKKGKADGGKATSAFPFFIMLLITLCINNPSGGHIVALIISFVQTGYGNAPGAFGTGGMDKLIIPYVNTHMRYMSIIYAGCVEQYQIAGLEIGFIDTDAVRTHGGGGTIQVNPKMVVNGIDKPGTIDASV